VGDDGDEQQKESPEREPSGQEGGGRNGSDKTDGHRISVLSQSVIGIPARRPDNIVVGQAAADGIGGQERAFLTCLAPLLLRHALCVVTLAGGTVS
jgi:hypothetical protein